MKAIVYTTYGSPDVLTLKEIPIPAPKENEVLIRVKAASINSWDWDMIRGKPWIVRMWGLTKPRHIIPGADVAGIVEAVGKNVSRFKIGDEVFGDLAEAGWGGYAEYVCSPENFLTLKPDGVTFEEAASIPQAGALALQGVRDHGKVQKGEHVLINGAGGGVGTFAVQLAKLYGAELTAVDSQDKHDLLLKLGSDHVIDFRQEDFTKNGKQYDLIVDVISNRKITQYAKSLKPNGRAMLLGGTMNSIFSAMFFGKIASAISGKTLRLMGYKANKDMYYLANLIHDKTISAVIENEFTLSETSKAFQCFSTGTTRGKVIIKI